MKDIYNRRQRFSLRKYSVGVCSVLLGTALFAAGATSASAEEVASTSESAEATAASESQAEPESAKEEEAASTAPSTYAEGAPVAPKVDLSNSSLAAEVKEEVALTPLEALAKAGIAVPSESTSKKTEEEAKAATKAEASAKSEKAASTTATSENADLAETSEVAPTHTPEVSATLDAIRLDATANNETAVAQPRVNRAALYSAATDTVNAGALATNGGRRRSRRAVDDHNVTPVEITTYLKPGETANPSMVDANGASVRSQTVPSGYAAKEGDVYTYSIVDLTRFNERYHTNYYTRAYKRFDASTDTTVELIDKNTGNVVETRKITASSGIQKFTTTATASRGELTWQVDFDKGLGTGPGKTDQPFIQLGYEVGASIQALVAPGHNLTPDEKKLYDDVYAARTSTDIINVVEPAYNGRTITDTNAKIPVSVNKTTYYKVVDKNNPTFNANKRM